LMDHVRFNHFITSLFSSVPMLSIGICDMLGIILILRHPDVIRDFPNHALVVKINSLEDAGKILEWHEYIKQSFLMENEQALPLASIQSQPIGEVLAEQSRALCEIRDSILQLQANVVVQERFNQSLVAAVQSTEEFVKHDHNILLNQTEMLQFIANEVGNRNVRRRRTDTSTNSTVRRQLHLEDVIATTTATAAAPQSADDVLPTISADSAATTNGPQRENSLLKLKDLKSLFYSWYKDDLWLFQPQGKNERSVLRKLSELIIYLKLFLKADCTVLSRRPNRIVAEEANQYRLWLNELRSCSLSVQNDAMKFCKDYSVIVDPMQPLKDVVVRKGALWAAEKLLKKIPAGRFPIQQTIVVDNLTLSSANIYNCSNISSFHKVF